jgi:hypothetical protein
MLRKRKSSRNNIFSRIKVEQITIRFTTCFYMLLVTCKQFSTVNSMC